MKIKKQEHTCLHTDHAGIMWGMTPQGVAKPVGSQDLETVLRSAAYRIVGLPINYRLITQLYSQLIGRKAKAQVWVGSPEVCPSRNCEPAPLLSCLSVLDVHDNLHHRWHMLNSEAYNNFLLLNSVQEEGFSDLTLQIYNSHCLRPFCQFIEMNDAKAAINLIACIGDPRWYINPSRLHRLSRIESYFGLVPTQFSDSRDTARRQRFQTLIAAFESLPRDGLLWGEIAMRSQSKIANFKGYKLLLGFLIRNWLTKLTPLVHFDPVKFFVRTEAQSSYVHQFKD